jgi:hypothetical protein
VTSASIDLGLGRDAPDAPGRTDVEWLIRQLARLVEVGGAARLLAEPIAPEPASFPDAWQASPARVVRVIERLLWHAGVERRVVVVDRRDESGTTHRRVATECDVVDIDVNGPTIDLDLHSIGDDDVVGTLAHEVGVAVAVISGVAGGDPYRDRAAVSAWSEDDLRIGSVAAVWAGLGVLAANAAFQQYSGGVFQPHRGFAPVEYDVIRAGHLPLPALAFLLAIQIELRDARLPRGLGRPQTDEVRAWQRALRGKSATLRSLLGIAADATPLARTPPPPLPALPD